MKNMFTKALSIALSGTIVILASASLFTVTASAENKQNVPAELSIANVEAHPGDTIAVPISIKNNPGIVALGALLNVSPELQYEDWKSKKAFQLIDVYYNNDKNTIAIGSAAISLFNKDQDMIELIFSIPIDSKPGTVYSISWNNVDQIADNYQNFEYETFDGSITVVQDQNDKQNSEESQDILGDVNSDGIITASDASLVLKYYTDLLSSGNTAVIININLADVNNDNQITAKDATIILIMYTNTLKNK